MPADNSLWNAEMYMYLQIFDFPIFFACLSNRLKWEIKVRSNLDIVEIIDAGLETLSNLVTIALFLFKTSLKERISITIILLILKTLQKSF